MATTTTGLSSPGVGSGLDVNSIVGQLVALERRPIDKLLSSAQRIQTQISGIGQLQSLTSALRDAATELGDAKGFEKSTVSSSDSAVVSATTTTGGNPVAGSYAIATVSLAASQIVATAKSDFASSAATVGAGTLAIELGSWKPDLSGFTAKAEPRRVEVEVAETDTLAQVRDKINAADAGVTASIITDSSGARLSLRSKTTGQDNGFRITATDADGNNTDGAGLSRLAFDPAGGTTRASLTVAAADAVASVNGVEVRSPSDTFDGVVEGLAFTVRKAPASEVTVSVATDTESVRSRVARFVAAYNALAKFLAAQTAYDAETRQSGLFQGDSGVVSIFNQMRNLVGTSSLASPSLQSLSSLGIELQKDGTLQINSARLESALKNLPALAASLTREVAGQPALSGSMVRFKSWTDGLLGTDGSLPGRTQSLKARLDDNQRAQQRLEDRIAMVEKRLRAQYSTLDVTVNKANALNSYVSQQITGIQNLNKATSR